jgi:hypothetical protein
VRSRNRAELSASCAQLLAAGISLHTDAVTAEVVSTLQAARIHPILLRGPAIAQGLYGDAAARSYVDIDLLVARDDFARAEQVLSKLAFSDETVEGVLAGDRPTHAHIWVRSGDGAAVDLHYTLLGVSVPPEEVWQILRGCIERMSVREVSVDVLKPAGLAVVVALHAAQHGVRVEKPLDDLTRAIELLPDEVWEAASALAARLAATAAFGTGIRMLAPGAALARRLELPAGGSVETTLRASTAPPTALGFDWLARTPGGRAKVRLVVRKLVPDAAFMRAWSRVARRGPVGLAAAYVLRVLWLARHAPSGFRAWRHARRAVR